MYTWPFLWGIHLQLQWASLLGKVAGHLLHKSFYICYNYLIHFQTNELSADFTAVGHGWWWQPWVVRKQDQSHAPLSCLDLILCSIKKSTINIGLNILSEQARNCTYKVAKFWHYCGIHCVRKSQSLLKQHVTAYDESKSTVRQSTSIS